MPQPPQTLIYRITHWRNVAWVLDHGLHAANGTERDPDFVPIGLENLIEKRLVREVNRPPGGTLADYVPFYFGTHSRMLYNIHTGYNVPQRPPGELVYLVSSVEKAAEVGAQLLVTDRHAKVADANFFPPEGDWKGRLDWPLITGRDFRKDPNDPRKMERREAECLIYRHLPLGGLLGITCHDAECANTIKGQVTARGLSLYVCARPHWYF